MTSRTYMLPTPSLPAIAALLSPRVPFSLTVSQEYFILMEEKSHYCEFMKIREKNTLKLCHKYIAPSGGTQWQFKKKDPLMKKMPCIVSLIKRQEDTN